MAPVVLGKRIMAYGVATHWAIKVGDTWYEVASKKETVNGNRINPSEGHCSRGGCNPAFGGLVGNSSKSKADIEQFNSAWCRRNPTYHVQGDNCQKFATELAEFLCDGRANLPRMEGGNGGHGVGPRANAAASGGTAIAEVTTGRTYIQRGPSHASAEGPSASAKALCGKEGFGAFTGASAGRAEVGLGPLGVHIEPNINTGIGYHKGNAEISVLGFGVKSGAGGLLQINTPLGGAKCTIM